MERIGGASAQATVPGLIPGKGGAMSLGFQLLGAVLLTVLTGPPGDARGQAEPPPTLIVDSPANGASVTPGVTLEGWAIGPASGGGTGVDGVRAYLDGPADTGTLLGDASYG